MVDFLIKRPIAVSMTFLAIMVLGLAAISYLPVSLVPDLDIPRIAVRVEASQYPARELENSILNRLRQNLMQVNNLHELRSEARDGSGLISMEFAYGTNIDLAYIEINEQVDKATAHLPRELPRPAVIKASASDIPVFYLEISHKDLQQEGSPGAFLELSHFADEIIRRRLEQIPQVAMADMSGRSFPEIIITPDMDRLQALNIPLEMIENTIRAASINLGNIILRDKQYQYHVRMGTPLLQPADIGNLYFKHHDRIWQIHELCQIDQRAREATGMIFSQGQRAISLAIVKQADARMQDLKHELHALIAQFNHDYPHLLFTVTRDQTALLDYTLENLWQTLLLGAVLALVVMFLFLRDPRSPWLIVISVPAALIVSLLFFFAADISINIISISGLILCVGMMIDNSIIVIDNITQHRQRGNSLAEACVKGTNEVFRPLLSSVLTTCSVFIPLIFLGGLAGALFYDQAMAVSIGLLVSLLIAITLTPVYYHLLCRKSQQANWLGRVNPLNYQKLYNKGINLAMRHQGRVWGLFVVLIVAMPLWFSLLTKERMPAMERHAILLHLDWNENIHVEENKQRLDRMLEGTSAWLSHNTLKIGQQQFLLDRQSRSAQQSLLYLQCNTPDQLLSLQQHLDGFLEQHFPRSIWHYEEEGNLFDQLFASHQPLLEARLRPTQAWGTQLVPLLQNTLDTLTQALQGQSIAPLAVQQSMVLEANMQMLSLYDTDMPSLQRTLNRAFNENQVITLADNHNVLPVKLGEEPRHMAELLLREKHNNRQGVPIPLQLLLNKTYSRELHTITAGLEGEYYPVALTPDPRQIKSTMEQIRNAMTANKYFEVAFSGAWFAQQELMKELLLIGLVALLLLFFILAAQFESLALPVIVLLEVPLAMSGALFLLWISGASLNIMSMIGLVVMTGIIINDSILKIDTINRLRAQGMSLLRAIITAGHYRLKPILMTSITTIFALLPFLFIKGLGGELQKPLALAVIGGLGLGTLVSLFFIPVCYYYLFKTKHGK